MSDYPSWDGLDRYFSGACSREEAEDMTRWVESDPERRHELGVVRRIWEAGAGRREFDVNSAWRIMHDRIVKARRSAAPLRLRQRYPTPRARTRRVHRLFAAAAVVIVVIATGVLLSERRNVDGLRPSGAIAATREYATRRGQRAEVLLTDGTRVLLSVESHLRVPVSYATDARDVYLDGEAFFEVRHDARKPFRVHTTRAVAEDMGTTFLVRAYPRDTVATVAVATGQIALRGEHVTSPGISLTPGQLAQVNAAGAITVANDVDLSRYLGWMQGRIEIHKRPFAVAARELERWYDVQIAIDDSALAHATLSATFENQPLDEVLDIVARSLGVHYTRQGTQVRFSARPSPR